MRGPYGARTGIAQDPCGVLRIIRSNHKCSAVRGPRSLMWPQEQHRRKIHTGDSLGRAGEKSYGCQNRAGPVDGCDWGIRKSHRGHCMIISPAYEPNLRCYDARKTLRFQATIFSLIWALFYFTSSVIFLQWFAKIDPNFMKYSITSTTFNLHSF